MYLLSIQSVQSICIAHTQVHYYQPLWTLVGGGEKTVQDSARPMSSVMPKDATWIKAKVEQFDPAQNIVYTSDNRKVRLLIVV